MSEERVEPEGEGFSAKVESAERRLREAADSAAAAEERAVAEVRALEADLEKERQEKEQAIVAAEARLAEIERQAEAAERRVEEAARRAAEAEGAIGDAGARAREAAAAWLREQVESIRREAGRR